MIAAAGVHDVVQQRAAVARQRDAPDDAVETAAEQIERTADRALAEPGDVDELQEGLALEAGMRGQRVQPRASRVGLHQKCAKSV